MIFQQYKRRKRSPIVRGRIPENPNPNPLHISNTVLRNQQRRTGLFNLWNLLNERCSTSESLSPAERNVTDLAHRNAQPMLCLGGKPGILWQHPGSSSRSRVAQCLWDLVKTQCVLFCFFSFPSVNTGQLRSQCVTLLRKQILWTAPRRPGALLLSRSRPNKHSSEAGPAGWAGGRGSGVV